MLGWGGGGQPRRGGQSGIAGSPEGVSTAAQFAAVLSRSVEREGCDPHCAAEAQSVGAHSTDCEQRPGAASGLLGFGALQELSRANSGSCLEESAPAAASEAQPRRGWKVLV